ncbi:MAG: 50S ribosomal protein L4 [Elusimicrobia bacterium]|nr:50S ribosomal protein L4 [Elusimicrobiota bacterium]
MERSATWYSQEGDPQGQMSLPPQIFGGARVSVPLLHEVTTAYLANRRAGTASTKTRSEVSGGGHKPWRQKGTGRARQGSIRSPLWRKGGIIFGPKPRSFAIPVPERKRHTALQQALSVRAAEGAIVVVDGVLLPEPKTRHLAQWCARCHLSAGSLLVIDRSSEELKRASRNLATLEVTEVASLNAYSVLRAKRVVFTRPALEHLVKHLNN